MAFDGFGSGRFAYNSAPILIDEQQVSTERCLVCDALKDSVHFLENGVVYMLFYHYILELYKEVETHVKVRFISLGD